MTSARRMSLRVRLATLAVLATSGRDAFGDSTTSEIAHDVHIGIEPALGVGAGSIRASRSGDVEKLSDNELSEFYGGSVVQLGLVAQWRLSRTLWIGPRLAGSFLLSGSAANAALDLGALGHFRLTPQAQMSPRLVFGGGASAEFMPARHSFAIRRDIDPALGAHLVIGLGFDRVNSRGTRRWYTDLRLDIREGYSHPHTMTDSRTGDVATETLEASHAALMFVFGVVWQ